MKITLAVAATFATLLIGPGAAVPVARQAAPDLAPLGAMLEVSLPHRSFSYTGQLSGASDRWTLAGGARLGDSEITQSFTGASRGGAPVIEPVAA